MRKHSILRLILLGLSSTPTLAQPTVTTVAPGRNARAVAPASNVSLTFSQPMSSAAATLGAVRVFDGGRRKAGSAVVTGNALVFDPALDFRPGETVTAVVTTAARSSAGAALGQPLVWQFTTATAPAPGTFVRASYLAGTNAPYDFNLADLDNDGDLDMFTVFTQSTSGSGPSIPVSIRFNDGRGNFGAPQPVAAGGANRPLNTALGDIDNDGDIDFVVEVPGTGINFSDLAVRLNDGQGNFSLGSTTTLAMYGGGTTRLADVNGDGYLDALVSQFISDFVGVYLNDQNGGFNYFDAISTSGHYCSDMGVADVDGDGDLDVFTANGSSQDVCLNLNDGTGRFAFPGLRLQPGSTLSPRLGLGDIDGDGDVDLVTHRNTSQELIFWLNNGSGAYTASPVTTSYGYGSFKLADLDGDGDLDILAVDVRYNLGARVLLNNGQGLFTPGSTTGAGQTYGRCALGDLDGDGRIDFAVAESNFGPLATPGWSVYLNQIILSTTQPPNADSFLRWPNPVAAGDWLHVQLPAPQPGTIVRLQSMLGRTVREVACPEGRAAVSTAGLARGAYVLLIQQPSGTISRRVVLE